MSIVLMPAPPSAPPLPPGGARRAAIRSAPTTTLRMRPDASARRRSRHSHQSNRKVQIQVEPKTNALRSDFRTFDHFMSRRLSTLRQTKRIVHLFLGVTATFALQRSLVQSH